MSRLSYLTRSLLRTMQPGTSNCPNCGSPADEVVARKYGVFALRRCPECALQFRTPVDAQDHGEQFYQEDYAEGMTTEMPDAAELAALKQTRFAGSDRDYANRIALIKALGVAPPAKLFDYGCSWGYGSWQFGQSGYQVEAFELSRPRRQFAREQLGVSAHDRFPAETVKPGSFDVFFSSHVLEHVPAPGKVLAAAIGMVRPGGYVVTIVPNGSSAARRADSHAWMTTWGDVHPNLIDDRFLARAYDGHPTVMFSSAGNRPLEPGQRELLEGLGQDNRGGVGDLSGFELIAVMRKA